MKIEDNFLDQKEFDKIQKLVADASQFPWYYSDDILTPLVPPMKALNKIEDNDNFQFVHIFYDKTPISPFMHTMGPILEVINPAALYRIKANLLTRTPEIAGNQFHADLEYLLSEEKQKQWTTSILYVNTNNGYTRFEDGTNVESVANRMVSFPANMKHTGTSCTDKKIRVVINFNYFEKT